MNIDFNIHKKLGLVALAFAGATLSYYSSNIIFRIFGVYKVFIAEDSDQLEIAAILSEILFYLIVDPILESVLLILVLEALRKVSLSHVFSVLIAGSILAVYHSVQGFDKVFIVAPVFFIGSYIYLYLRHVSILKAALAVVLAHALHNLPPVILKIETIL